MQPDIEVLCIELKLFQHHCQKNRAEIEITAEATQAARLTMEFGKSFHLYEQMLSSNSNGTNNISGKRTQFLQIKVDQDSDAFAGTAEQGGSLGFLAPPIIFP